MMRVEFRMEGRTWSQDVPNDVVPLVGDYITDPNSHKTLYLVVSRNWRLHLLPPVLILRLLNT
jgi:hypothetical protein